MPKQEWDEIDEQMAREGAAVIRRMTSVSQPRRKGADRDNLLPGRHRVPLRGCGAGDAPKSLGQVLQGARS